MRFVATTQVRDFSPAPSLSPLTAIALALDCPDPVLPMLLGEGCLSSLLSGGEGLHSSITFWCRAGHTCLDKVSLHHVSYQPIGFLLKIDLTPVAGCSGQLLRRMAVHFAFLAQAWCDHGCSYFNSALLEQLGSEPGERERFIVNSSQYQRKEQSQGLEGNSVFICRVNCPLQQSCQ